MTSVTIPEGVTSIDYNAFYDCSSLRIVSNLSSLDIVKGSDTHGYVAYYADMVENYEIFNPTTGHLIVNQNFNDNDFSLYPWGIFGDNIKSVEFTSNVTSIGKYAFRGCSSLESVYAPKSVTSIGYEAFYGCSSLVEVFLNMPKLSNYGYLNPKNCFDNMSQITLFVSDDDDDDFFGVNEIGDINAYSEFKEIAYGWKFYPATGRLFITGNFTKNYPWYSERDMIVSVEMAPSVTNIGAGAFDGYINLMKVTIGENVTSIGDYAFRKCSGLSELVIPNSVTSIGGTAFFACIALEKLSLGDGVSNIGAYAFADCDALEELILGSNVSIVGTSAFEACDVLKQVTVSPNVTTIGTKAFYNCLNLKTVINQSNLEIENGSTKHGYVAYYADKVLNFIKPLQLQKGEMYALSVPVVSEMVVTWSSSDASVATVDQNGNVTAVGTGVATITATAGGYSATCEVTVTITDGVYYMKNVGAGLFLTGGNAWGTQGTFSENGFDVTVTTLPSGKYVIDTKVFNWGNHYLGADGFIDAPQAEWTIEPQTDGTYTITNDGVNYIGYDGSTAVLNLHLTNSSEDNAHWQFMTYEEVMAEISTATKDNPKIVTMLLPGASFNKNDTRNGLWSDAPAVGGYLTDVATNMCGEKWNTPSFDVAQTLTNVPNGYYKISMQGFYRMGGDASENDATIAAENHAAGTETLNAIFYANKEEKPLMSIIEGAQAEEFAYGGAFYTAYGNVPQDMDAAAAAFTDGKYEHSLWVEVTDGTLRVGVKKNAESFSDWTIFDNFRVVYYGTQQPDAIEEATAIVTFQTNDVYDLSGRLVRRQAESLDGLKPGVYIINGKKYMVK